jgi:hypothetical protein
VVKSLVLPVTQLFGCWPPRSQPGDDRFERLHGFGSVVLVKSGRTLNPSASSRMAVPSGFHQHGFQLPTPLEGYIAGRLVVEVLNKLGNSVTRAGLDTKPGLVFGLTALSALW